MTPNNHESLSLNFAQLILLQSASLYGHKFEREWRKKSTYSLQSLFKNIQTIVKPKVCIEAGAHEANFSIAIKKLLPNTLVYAFEADPTNYEHFKVKKEKDFESLGVNYLNLAIGSEMGTVEISRHKNIEIAGNNSLLIRKEGSEKYKPVSVSQVSLDAYFESNEFSTADFSIWIDVEGLAYKVLQGAENILARTLSLFIEVEDKSFWFIMSSLFTKGDKVQKEQCDMRV